MLIGGVFETEVSINKSSIGTPSLASNNVSVISNCKSDVPYDNVSTTKSLHDLNEDRDNDPGETAFPEMHQNTSPFEWSRFEELSVPELVPLLTALRLEATSTEQPPFPDESEAEDSEYLLNSELQDMSKNGSVSGIDNIDLCLTLCNNSIQDTNQEALNNTPQYPWRDPENVFMGTTISPLNEIYVFPPSQVLPRTRKSNVVDLWSCLSAEASKLEVKLGKLETQFGNHNPAVIAVMEQLSSIYCRLDDLRQAERLKQRLADIYCQTFGSNNVRTLQAALSVVEILVEQGQLLKAEALSHGLRSSISELVEQTHPLAISANFIYARICDYFGRSEEAERCFRQHLQVMLSLHGPKALSTIRATAALGAGIDEKRASKEKEILLRIAAQLVVELPPVDESPFPVYRTIISQLHTLGLYEECYQIATRVLERFSLPLGDQHPTIWKARDQLAWGMGAVGRHRESIKLFRAVITHQEETAGNIDGYFVNTWSGLANTLFDSGESDEAMIRYERAFKARLDLYGASNKFTISIAYHLGWFYYDRSRYMEALDVYNKMVHMLCESGNQEVAMLKFKSHALYIKMLIGQGTGGNLQGKFEAATVEAKSV